MILHIAAGGAAGALARFAISGWVTTWAAVGFPWATFAVNATGSALLGLLLADPPRPGRSARVQAALTTGFCGGFTTFSTFSYELLVLLRDADYAVAAAYAVASVVVCTVGLAAGLSVRRGWQAW